MASRPFLQLPIEFWHGPEIRRLTYEQRGILVEVMFLMNQCDEVGVLSTYGRAWSIEDLAASIGGPTAEPRAQIDGLLSTGVLSRDDHGKLICPWMIFDRIRRENAAKSGKKGGNPTLKGRVKGKVKGTLNRPMVISSCSSSSSSEGVTNSEGGVGETPAQGGDSAPTEIVCKTVGETELLDGLSGPELNGKSSHSHGQKKRIPDHVWDAWTKRFYPEGVPTSQKSKVGLEVQSLKEMGVTQENASRIINERADRLIEWLGTDGATPTALVKHWQHANVAGTVAKTARVAGRISSAKETPAAYVERCRREQAAREFTEPDSPIPKLV